MLIRQLQKNIAYATAKAVVGSLPVVGAAASELLGLIVTPPLEKRRNKLLTLKELEESKRIKIEDLSQNEHFIDTALPITPSLNSVVSYFNKLKATLKQAYKEQSYARTRFTTDFNEGIKALQLLQELDHQRKIEAYAKHPFIRNSNGRK